MAEQTSREVPPTTPISFIVRQYVEEIRRKIEEEFIEVLQSNVINPYEKDTVLLGKNFAFKYVGVKRFKQSIHLHFEVYRIHELKHIHEKYRHVIGKIIVFVKIGGGKG